MNSEHTMNREKKKQNTNNTKKNENKNAYKQPKGRNDDCFLLKADKK